MFKNVCLYRLPADWQPSVEEMEQALQANRFAPCGATQEKSVGWIEPRGEAHGPLVESVDGQRILRLAMESKSVPGSVVRKKAQEEADHIEATTGRKPGKKETRALKEDALLALLPQAFARESFTWVWIDLRNGWLVIDASSQGKVDEVISALVDVFDGLPIAPVHTAMTPQTAMSNWLLAESLDDLPGAFCVERECELKSNDEERSAVKFTRHNLATEEVRQHIREGKLPTRLAMSWEGRIGFVLTESMQLRKLAFLEGVFEDRAQVGGDESGFDTDVALSTGELRQLIPALIEALEGEISAEDALAAATASAKANAQTPESGKVHSQVTSTDDATEAPF